MESIVLLNDNVNAMDTTFTMRDVIYIVSILISGTIAWFGMHAKITKVRTDKEMATLSLKTEIKGLKLAQEQASTEYKEAILNAKAGRNSIRHEYKSDVEKKEQILHQRIDRVRDDSLKSYEKLEKRIDDLSTKQDSHTNTILAAINNNAK